jgi:hypothetical protein
MRRALGLVLCGALAAGAASAEGLDWEVEESADAPAPVQVARNVRDGAIGLADAFFDANTAVFGCFALAASQVFMGAGDLVGLVDDNPVTQHVTKGVLSKNLAKIGYLWHLAGAESLLGSHGLEVERWATSDAATLSPLLSDEDVAELEGPLPLDPLVFVEDSMFHADAYQPAAPLVDLGAAVLVDGFVRPAASLLRFAQQREQADALDETGSEWFRRALEWGWR